MIISAFEIHLKPPLSQSIPIPHGSFVRNVRASSRRKSFVRSRYRIRTAAHPYRTRYLNDTSGPPPPPSSRYRDIRPVCNLHGCAYCANTVATANRGQTRTTIIRVLNTGYIAALLPVLTRVPGVRIPGKR